MSPPLLPLLRIPMTTNMVHLLQGGWPVCCTVSREYKVGDVLSVLEPHRITLIEDAILMGMTTELKAYTLKLDYLAGGSYRRRLHDPADVARARSMKTIINGTPRAAHIMPTWAVRHEVEVVAVMSETSIRVQVR